MKKHKKFIIWGAKLDTGHTNGYVHAGMLRAAQAMGLDAYWLDNRDKVDEEFFDDAIIFTEQWLVFRFGTSVGLPLRKSSTYVVHFLGNKGPVEGNPGAGMYLGKVGKLIDYRFACGWGDGPSPKEDKNYNYTFKKEMYEPINNGHSFYEKDSDYDKMYSFWATDLLPDEINYEDRFIKRAEPKYAFFGGTVREDNAPYFYPFLRACQENKIQFIHNCPWQNPLPIDEIRKMVVNSYMAFEIRPPLHLANDYVPCRTFKNISYGHLALTNSKAVYNYFDGDVAFSEDTYELFEIAKSKLEDKDMILRQMVNVKENHTYINRVKDIITAAEI